MEKHCLLMNEREKELIRDRKEKGMERTLYRKIRKKQEKILKTQITIQRRKSSFLSEPRALNMWPFSISFK